MTTDTFPPGATVRLADKRRARYVVRRHYDNGTVLLWGGTPGHEMFRHVYVQRLRPARKVPA